VTLLVAATAVIVTAIPLTRGTAAAGPENLLPAGLASLAWVVAAALSLRVVRQVQADEDRRSAVIQGGWRRGAPSWPVTPATIRPMSSRGPTWIVPLVLVGGLIGLVGNALGWSIESGGSDGVPTSPPNVALATARPVVTPSVNPSFALSPDPAGSPIAPPSQDPVSLALLAQHLVPGDGSCTAIPFPDAPAGSLAAIACRPANAAVATLRYAFHPTPEDAERAYSDELAATGLLPGTGDCFAGVPGESSFSTNGTLRGRVYCYVAGSGDVPGMAWVDVTLGIVGWATGTDTAKLQTLCDWWANESGPS
jgi:hypothetical protein